ncbi:hypothetical protein [Methylobacterium nodulans]|nr:hypothetical protein [Methylobacterium nodulans]
MTAFLDLLLRRAATALLGLIVAVLAVSAASAAGERGGAVMRAVTPQMIDASLHADLPTLPLRCITSVSAPGEPTRGCDEGAQGPSPIMAQPPAVSASVLILPPRHLGSCPLPCGMRLDRPPKPIA